MLANQLLPNSELVLLGSALRALLREMKRKKRKRVLLAISVLVLSAGNAQAEARWRLIKEASERDTS